MARGVRVNSPVSVCPCIQVDSGMAWDFDTHLRTGKQAAVLRVRDLTVRIQTEEALVLPVDRVSFDLEHGEALGLIGESGSGKTTVALSLLRLLPPGASVSGRVELAGEDLLASDPARVRRVRGRRIAMVFHDPLAALNPVLTIGTQIAEAVRAHQPLDRRQARAATLELLRSVGLADADAARYPHQLSGGMRQRALIAMALGCQPEILVADEPTSALDPVVQAGILALLRRVREERGLSLLLATHDLGVAAGSLRQDRGAVRGPHRRVRRDRRGARTAPPSLHARAPPEPAASSGERGRTAAATHRGPTPGDTNRGSAAHHVPYPIRWLPFSRPLPAGERGLREGGAGAGGDGRRAGGVLPPVEAP